MYVIPCNLYDCTSEMEGQYFMGAKTAVLIYADGDVAELLCSVSDPRLDATAALVSEVNPDWTKTGDSMPLSDCLYPPAGFGYAASFPGIDIICDRQLMVDHPSRLPNRFLQHGSRRRVILHTMHSTSDWFAYAIWESGELIRSLSLAPDSGVVENIGSPLPFEVPFWAGEHPVTSSGQSGYTPYSLPFHPLELGGEAAMRALLGFIVEGQPFESDIDPEEIEMIGFRTSDPHTARQADIEEFQRTHTLVRYTYGPDGTQMPIED